MSLINSKTVLELYHMEMLQRISVPNCHTIEDNGEEEYRSDTSITKLLRPDTE